MMCHFKLPSVEFANTFYCQSVSSDHYKRPGHLDRFGVQLYSALSPAHHPCRPCCRCCRPAATSVLLRRPLPTSSHTSGLLRFVRVGIPLEVFTLRQLGFTHLGSGQPGQAWFAWRLQQHFWVRGLFRGGHLDPLRFPPKTLLLFWALHWAPPQSRLVLNLILSNL